MRVKIVNPERIKSTVGFFMKNMALFYVPVGVGIIANYHLFEGNFWAIIISVILSTIIVLLSTGYIQQTIERWKR